MKKMLPDSLPKIHREFLNHAIVYLAQQSWLVGIAATGSFVSDTMDAFSDIDLVLAIEPEEHATVMANRRTVAESLGQLLSAFTGEHVGEPRLLLCLYGPPLLHVDIQFFALPDTAKRADDVIVLWERDGRLSNVLQSSYPTYPVLNPQWIEDRFWVWVHKAGGKIGRGEIFEAIEYLSFLRNRVLGPLSLRSKGQYPIGMRRIEIVAPYLAEELKATIARHDPRECLAALRACVELYRQLRAHEETAIQCHQETEKAVIDYLAEIENRLS